CDVMPDIETDIDIEIREEDIKMEVFRASGAGGQHINKTSSAIRITHIPTGIVTQSQSQRSQFQNRDLAMAMLKAKLYQLEEENKAKELAALKGEQKDIAWGSQIRSYVFHPYAMVKDHRTGYEVGNTGAVMDGDLNGFIDAYLKWQMGDSAS
ncbi:MAG: peptide chain release factor 2, partial [Abiotrophia defectiva]|nr:peptide chain release factor 2 [Abiotrophia defectiva]